jgi:hypothetical protein
MRTAIESLIVGLHEDEDVGHAMGTLPISPFVLEARSIKTRRVVVAKKAKKAVRREYTKADVKELRAHSKARTPVARIAKLTQRTEASLRNKATNLGISLGHRR